MSFAQGKYLAMPFTRITKAGNVGALSRLLAKIGLIHVVTVETIAVADIVLDIDRTLVNVNRRCRRTEESWGSVNCSIGSGNKSSKRFHCCIRAGCNCGQLRRRKDLRRGQHTLAVTLAFIRREEERLIFYDRSADVATELIAFKRALRERRSG